MTYPGGKGGEGVWQRIINQMPPHELYIEAFLGGGAVMASKRPAPENIGIEVDPEVAARWESGGRFKFINCDAFDYLKKLVKKPPYKGWEHETLIYCDPPYLISTRRQHRPICRYELTEEDHEQLLAIIMRLPCMVMMSGYYSELYARELADWRAISFEAMTRGGKPATEWLWMNFPEPSELHDYRYLGEGFRERERIKRKVNRWKTKLEKMPALERMAIAAALAEVGDTAGSLASSSDARSRGSSIAESDDGRGNR